MDTYEKEFEYYQKEKDVNISFSANNSFGLGIAGAGAIGASTAWLATSTTAWVVGMLGPMAGFGSLAAVGGVLGISVVGVVALGIAIKRAITWKKDLAKAIIDGYEKEDYRSRIMNEIEKYWTDTRNGFKVAVERIESDWKKKIEEYESLVDEDYIESLKSKLLEAHKGLDFFHEFPLQENG